ncbi:hypothetical protein BH11PSE14_BH11PSE14_22320 [soil metagenome]
MNGKLRIVLLALAAFALSGCATGGKMDWNKLGWHKQKAAPSEVVLVNCQAAVGTLKGRADYDTALDACTDAKTRQGRN